MPPMFRKLPASWAFCALAVASLTGCSAGSATETTTQNVAALSHDDVAHSLVLFQDLVDRFVPLVGMHSFEGLAIVARQLGCILMETGEEGVYLLECDRMDVRGEPFTLQCELTFWQADIPVSDPADANGLCAEGNAYGLHSDSRFVLHFQLGEHGVEGAGDLELMVGDQIVRLAGTDLRLRTIVDGPETELAASFVAGQVMIELENSEGVFATAQAALAGSMAVVAFDEPFRDLQQFLLR